MNEDRITVLTPEAVEFDFQLADLGSRFIAISIDTIIQLLISLPIILLIYLIRVFWWFSDIQDTVSPWIAGILFILLFIMGFSGYHIFFELIWNGRTPGKRITHIRTVRDGGFPIQVASSFIRNLIRIVDFLPFYYSTGIISILLTKNKKRLGDIVAGSMVIREYTDFPPPALNKSEEEHMDCLNLSPICLEKINLKEYLLIREFLLRKGQLEEEARDRLSSRIAIPLIEKLSLDRTSWDDRHILFLEELGYSLRSNEKFL